MSSQHGGVAGTQGHAMQVESFSPNRKGSGWSSLWCRRGGGRMRVGVPTLAESEGEEVVFVNAAVGDRAVEFRLTASEFAAFAVDVARVAGSLGGPGVIRTLAG